MNLGFGEIAIILFVALLFFGPSKLPELGKAAGASLKEFKKAVSGIMEDEEQQSKEENKKQ
ncbi:twin-arginine translocase TatA/TatE family subunit [Rossellomorea sp. SC111]|uniref:twin-arginine translocase TatA/TatE family subunit n=1 Tax=Rossellomorea sp. SC111 TaxID=2968985 RepID=UPI00215AA5BE|nr:twin-arginine translocase TatA/TatE family subunit [Rossellomorea sp. SC111]MCR8847446.1 twin-arginine translocase TatA/TatE family subunit [Rossellomorea sp. SC111]